ncbi:hemagglutination activity domain protein [Leptolyngbya sp. Heron Island J]|uniref:CHAT domain-containing protein n=1 Tax=Leptolyngbya sp. Heron Island J TaxID=1385935 RepID=UPI0003B9E156|nr:CHAT domain-containing protein [Leptolyngbya sp. Heron Island J]ESA32548.1 hemagglutination activity domain protein [Leptolyngbya sp. Heron Island J]
MFCLLKRHCVFCLVTLLGPGLATAAQAQSITAADQATTIQQTGNTYQIDGGNPSADSTVLFHSFEQFGLLTQETALFSNPITAENIIGRVIGGNASIIDGLLAVDGSANLYLVNPAGVLFGENAQLNLGGAFSASTATGLTFGTELFDILSANNNFNILSGTPTGYVFGNQTASAVVNAGNLAVESGQSLTLLGGQVINTGQLSAPNGDILVMAVPGENRVRLSQTGSLLSLELEAVTDIAPPDSGFTASTVPALLTGASAQGMATDITVNPDGTVSLSGSALEIPGDGSTTIISGQLSVDGGGIGILGDQVALVGASLDASGETGGGTILVGGDQLGAGTVPLAATTVIDQPSVIRADAQDLGDGGTIIAWGTELLRTEGELSSQGGANGGNGGLIETSSLGLLDIRTTPDVTAANGTGGLWLLDPANIRIVAGTDATNVSPINPFDVGILATDARLGVDLIENALAEGGNVEVRTTGDTPGDGNIILEVPLDYHLADDSSLSFVAEGEIQILADIADSQDTIIITEPEIPVVSLLPSLDNLELTLQANEQITVTGNINTGAGALTIESQQGDIAVSGNLSTSSGDVTLLAPQGAIDISAPIQTSLARLTAIGGAPPEIPAGGDVVLKAQDAISVDTISTSSDSVGGDVLIESQVSSITAGEIDTSISMFSSLAGPAGDVGLIAQDDIVFSSIDASSLFGSGGDVTINAFAGLVLGIGTVLPSSNTIITQGGDVNGNISIFHDGGSTDTPFVIGGASENGTAGDLITGTLTLSEITLEASFKGGLTVGNIDIITSEGSEEPEEPETPEEPEDIFEEVREILEETDCDCIRNESSDSTDDLDPTVDTVAVSEDLPVVAARPGLASLNQRFSELEDRLTTEFNDYLQLEADLSTATVDLTSAQSQLLAVQQKTGKKPALIYAVFGLDGVEDEAGNVLTDPKPSAPLELLLITATGDPVFVPLGVTRQEILTMAQRLRRQVSTPSRAVQEDTSYLIAAQALYQWLIAPLQPHLDQHDIDTISFVTDAGLRSLPLAALHDGKNFIIQNYNIGLMPSLSLTDLTYQDIRNTSALVAGTSTFADQATLPGVPVELDAIASTWTSKVLRDNAFNSNQLKQERQQNPYGIIHLATHGEFNVGDLSKSSLYLHNERLSLDQLRNLGLNRPSVELLTLSACQTALGNRSAELGFAGFAVLAGAKTSIASLWSVSDEASAGLMIELYRQLQENQPIIKAEALRQAQLAMIRGDITVDGDQLQGLGGVQKLPAELAIAGQQNFSHPYYWAAFSLVGSPW